MNEKSPVKLQSGVLAYDKIVTVLLYGFGFWGISVAVVFLGNIWLPISSIWKEISLGLPLLLTFAWIGIEMYLACTRSFLFFEDRIQICQGKFVVKTISADQLQLLCVVGNERGQSLCLSSCSVDELAEQQENRLLKRWITRSEVPLRKQNINWKKSFTKELLLREEKKPMLLQSGWKFLWFDCDLTVMAMIREFYPNIETADLLSKHGRQTAQNRSKWIPGNNFGEVTVDAEGIHVVCKGSKEPWLLAKDAVRTIVRVDQFADHVRNLAHHTPILIVTEMSVEEMADLEVNRHHEGWTMLNKGTELLAVKYCTRKTFDWSLKMESLVPLYDTSQNRELLVSTFKDARWIDFSSDLLE